jgi:type I restriction enzyme S subunit
MVSDWKELTLGEIAQNISRPFKFKDFEEVTFINTGDVLEGQFLHSNRVSKIGLPGQAKKEIQEGDILFSEIRPANKRFALVDFDPKGYVVSTKFMVIKKIFENIDDRFFYILLTNKITLHEFQRIAESRSGTFPQITFDAVAYFPVKIPPLPEQKAIAHILGSLDDKIELNRQMNETLEAMAQALFKSWFVDFDPVIDNALAAGNAIPDELLERAEQRQAIEKKDNSDIQNLFPNAFEFTEEMGWIPKGWGVSKLGEYIEVKRGGSPRPIHDYLVPKGLPWVKISDATASNSRFLVETKQFIKPEGLNKTTLLKKGSLILSNSATPGLPKFLDLDACIHDGWLHFPKKKIFTDNYLYQLFLVVRQELLMQGNGSVFTNLKTDILKNHMVVVPNIDVLNYFDNWINSFHNKIHAVQIDVDNLSRIRDTLLPKLMSGELRISDAAELVEEVV